MVNLKKIGAVATGALFLGATVGMAAAVDVPTISDSFFASNGVAKAQLVVGADGSPTGADGLAADKAAAQDIADAVASKMATSGLGGDITITYGSDDLNDNTTNENFAAGSGTHHDEIDVGDSGNQTLIAIAGSMNVDANGNGKLDDSADYPLYDGLYIIDKTTAQPYLTPAAESGSINGLGHLAGGSGAVEDSKGYGYLGMIPKIKGTKYIVIKETDTETATLAPLIKGTAADITTGNPADFAVSISGDLKIAYEKDANTTYFYDGTNLLKTLTITNGGGNEGVFNNSDLPSEFQGMKLFYDVGPASAQLSITGAEKSQGVEVTNGMTDAMGYNTIYYFTTAGSNNPEFSKVQNGMYLMGDPVTMVKGDKTDIPDTLFQLDLDISNGLDLVKKETVSVNSGTKLKSSSSKYNDFIDQTVTVATSGSDITWTYGSDDLMDDAESTADDAFSKFSATNVSLWGHPTDRNADKGSDEVYVSGSVNQTLLVINGSGQMRVDANGDGKLDSSTDYPLYDGLYIIDKTTAQPYYTPAAESGSVNGLGHMAGGSGAVEDSKGYGYLGMIPKIKGTKYIVIKETDTETATLAPLIKGTAADVTTGNPADFAVSISGDLKIAFEGSSNTTYFYDGTNLLKTLTISNAADTYGVYNNSDLPSEFQGLKLFYTQTSNTQLAIVGAEKSQGVEVTNGMTDAMGYNTVYYFTTAGSNNPEFSKIQNGMYLMGDPITMVAGDKVDIPDTLFQLDLDISYMMDLVKKETVSVNSGTKMKSTSSKYNDFISATISVAAGAGGSTVTPDMGTVDLAAGESVDSGLNEVLVGGPMANSMVASLVASKDSTIDWAASAGDIEKVDSNTIIVAGKTRAETQAAATALAGSF